MVENVVQHQDEHHHGDGAEREHRAADTETGSEELQYRCLRLDVLRADRLVGRIEEVCRENDLPHAERDDEGRQLDPRDEPAVDEAAGTADREAAQDGNGWRQAVSEGELPHDDGREHHDRADREVDTGSENDKGLRRADDADDRDLLQDQRQCEGREELGAKDDAEADHRRDQHDQRHAGGVGVQGMLDTVQRGGATGVEGGDIGRAAGQHRLVVLGLGRPRFAHG